MTEAQAKEISTMVSLTKLLVGVSFVLGGWQAFVTITLNQHGQQIAEEKVEVAITKLESNNRLKEWSSWREQMVSISARQTTLLEIHQSEISQLQARVNK